MVWILLSADTLDYPWAYDFRSGLPKDKSACKIINGAHSTRRALWTPLLLLFTCSAQMSFETQTLGLLHPVQQSCGGRWVLAPVWDGSVGSQRTVVSTDDLSRRAGWGNWTASQTFLFPSLPFSLSLFSPHTCGLVTLFQIFKLKCDRCVFIHRQE